MNDQWCIVYRTKQGPFAVHTQEFLNNDDAVMALVDNQALQSCPLVTETWRAQRLLAILNATSPDQLD